MPDKEELERFDTIEIRQLNTSARNAHTAAVVKCLETPEVSGLGLALYAGSTVFNSGQSTTAKLIGKQAKTHRSLSCLWPGH